MIRKFTISRDDTVYEAWPDVALTPTGKLICVFSECTHHIDRSYTRIVYCESHDRGRTWGPKKPLTAGSHGLPYWNCARVQLLRDGRLAAIVDQIHAKGEGGGRVCLFFSTDEGASWSTPVETTVRGIVPDRIVELENGRWLLSCHAKDAASGYTTQRLWYSDNQGADWEGPVLVAHQPGYNFCEVSILPVEGSTFVAFLRENSGMGLPCYKCLSHDNGLTWSEPVQFPLPGCHRPVAGYLQDGRIFITYRFAQGGAHRHRTINGRRQLVPCAWQNLFAAFTDKDSVSASDYKQAVTRILPIDFDRSPTDNDTVTPGGCSSPTARFTLSTTLWTTAPSVKSEDMPWIRSSDNQVGLG
ncbi:MAG: sialidase family protein [Limnochordia bacterium]